MTREHEDSETRANIVKTRSQTSRSRILTKESDYLPTAGQLFPALYSHVYCVTDSSAVVVAL